MATIQELIDRIPREADVRSDEYTVENRLQDLNEEYLYLVEHSIQQGSKFPATSAGDRIDIITITDDRDEVVYPRTLIDTSILLVEFTRDGTHFEALNRETLCRPGCVCYSHYCGITFRADEKNIYITNGRAGDIRITVEREAVQPFTLAEYNDGVTAPVFIPEAFHPLLWLKPALLSAGKYKTERYSFLRDEYDRKLQQFTTHYSRNAEDDLCIPGIQELPTNNPCYRR